MSASETAVAATERSVRILEAACTVIVRDGAHGLRMASVAREARVSKALVHYYFATRQELLRSALQFSEQRWNAALDEQLAALPTAAAKLERMLLAGIEPDLPFSEQRALGNEIWSTLRTDDELRPLVERSYRAWLARARRADRRRARGRLDPGRGRGASRPVGVSRRRRTGSTRSSISASLDRERAARLMRGAIALELGTA